MIKIYLRLFALPLCTLVVGWIWAGFTDEKIDTLTQSPSYPEHLTGAFTGGFSEETCRSCHFDYDLNPEGGSLTLKSIPPHNSRKNYRDLIIIVRRPNLGAAGFQVTARHPDGSQAGEFIIESSKRIQQTKQAPDSITYIQHSTIGTKPLYSDSTSWRITWKPPANPADTVLFNVAANAANGDQSEFGDWIYKKELVLTWD